MTESVALPRAAGGPACSTASRESGEPLGATAPPGRRWLLVEVPGAWGRDAFLDAPALDPAIGRRLLRRAAAAGYRIVAIRRPGRARGRRWRWAIADTDPGAESVRWGEAPAPEQLLDVPLDGAGGRTDTRPVVLVCAHGRHDECCAVRGRTVAAAIAVRYRQETWECSHLGGDRFAATMLLLPHGLHYGRVDDHDGPGIVAEYLRGRIVPDAFRGRTAFPRIVQAAQDIARLRSGDLRVGAHGPLEVEAIPTGWRIRLDGEPAQTVDVAESLGAPLFTTCGATTAVAVPRFAGERQAPIVDCLR